MSITQVYVTIRHVGCMIATLSSHNTRGGRIFLHYCKASMNSSIQRVNNSYLGEFVLPLVTDVSVVLVVQVIRFIIVSSSQNCHKSRITAALLKKNAAKFRLQSPYEDSQSIELLNRLRKLNFVTNTRVTNLLVSFLITVPSHHYFKHGT